MYKTLVGGIAALLVSGCATIGSVAPNEDPPGQEEAFFLVGIKAENTQVGFAPRLLSGGVLRQNIYRGVSFQGMPEDGYIMGRTRPYDLMVLAGAKMTREDGTKKSARSCGGRPGITFTAIPGKVVYPGDVVIKEIGGRLRFSVEYDPESARKIIEQKYPAMKDRLVMSKFIPMPDTTSCSDVVVTYR